MRRIIRIFLASSIVEFANERMAIENFIRNISDKFEENYDVKIQPLLCENFDDAYSKIRKQEEYNEKIRNSDLCFFIFFTKAGEYTREEFEVARKKFEETGKPKIYTYFKVIKDETAEQSLYDFMNELDKTFGHYYGTFEHIDTVKLRILLNLKLQEMDFLEIKVDGDACVVDGKKTLSLDNVAEFSKNKSLKILRDEFKKIDEEYCQLRPIYAKGNCDNTFCKKYCEIATKRKNLLDEIEELQKLIFNISLQMSYDDVHGEISSRQKEAYRLFELGDYDGCMGVLNSKDIDDDFFRERKRIKEQDIAVCRKYIKEHKTAIDILETMKSYKERFQEIEERYQKIIPIILEENINFQIVVEYIAFLNEQFKQKLAISFVETEIEKFLYKNEIDDKLRVKLFYIIAQTYKEQNKNEKAYKYFSSAMLVSEVLFEENKDKFGLLLVKLYRAVAGVYKDCNEMLKAKEYYLKSIEMGEKIQNKTKTYNMELANSYNSFALYLGDSGNLVEEERYYILAIEIIEKETEQISESFRNTFCMINNNLARLYKSLHKYDKSKKHYLKSLDIIKELSYENPMKYNILLAQIYHNVANLYLACNETEKVEYLFGEAIKIFKSYCADNPAIAKSYLLKTYKSLEQYYDKIVDKYNADKCRHCVESIGNNMEFEHNEYGTFDETKELENLALSNFERYGCVLAEHYNSLASDLFEKGKKVEASEYCEKAISIFESIFDKKSEEIWSSLAMAYFNCAIIKKDEACLNKAIKLAKMFPNDPNSFFILKLEN